ncbi:MAG: STAS domain-containing protein [Pirellulaceae bacterium]|nr:STAS domain-containing protein [Pirellulaceae bacterium]
MNIKILPTDDEVLRIEIVGNVTRESAAGAQDPLVAHLGAGVFSHAVLLSLQQTMYVDSSGVDWLIHCHRRFQSAGGRMVLHTLSPSTQQLLKMMRLDKVLEMEPTEMAARQRIRNSTGNGHGPPPLAPASSNGAARSPSSHSESEAPHDHPTGP